MKLRKSEGLSVSGFSNHLPLAEEEAVYLCRKLGPGCNLLYGNYYE